ncbi:hypothetical protein [uncultured Gimesia sp.]|uniref:beta-propeller domain-containing protein n=1 Tax=uncultured Gimesia sp. TaxID=1678688 RepID=UPI002629E4A3|nr:hypothetical protein [uncultured Gimesia sp.]
MSNTVSRREFLKSVGFATSTLGVQAAALAREKGKLPKDSSVEGGQLPEHPYEMMICDYEGGKLYRVDKRGKIIWEHRPEGRVWDFVLTDDNNIIYPMRTKKMEVRCINFEKKVIWSWPYDKEFREIINITKHQSQLILSGQMPPQAVLMKLDGTIQKKLPIPAKYKSFHGQLGNVYHVGNQHYLAQLWGEGTALEVDRNGKEVWRYQVPKAGKGRYPAGTVQDVLRLDNGNTLIACGTQARLLEIDLSGKIVWEFTGKDHPELNFTNACTLQKLKDGSLLITNFLRGKTGRGAHAFILSKEREITWKLTDHKNFTAASQVWGIEQ